MNRLALLSATVALFVWASGAQAQYYTTYYPTTTYYASAPTAYYASAPTTVYYGSAPTTTYYASAPTTVYYGSAPTTTYYASAPTTVYYGSPPAVTTYRPLVGRGITRVGYYQPAVAYPVIPTYQANYPWW